MVNKLNKLLKIIYKHFILFCIGGIAYFYIEKIFRYLTNGTDTHWSMFIMGGVIFILIGLCNEFYTWDMSFVKQCFIGSIIITLLEALVGYIINIKLGWNVWHYDIPLSFFYGQINLFFSIMWFFLSGVAVIVDDYLRYWLFKEDKPKYHLI